MGKGHVYEAKQPDANGHIHYTADEHAVWHDLIVHQRRLIRGRACQDFIDGLERLALPDDRVPQCADVSKRLQRLTGWGVEPVPALIELDWFFDLLAHRRFPAASFIRIREELEYLQEPDVFHEIFGHTPMLTDPRFAAFSEAYGKAGLAADDDTRQYLIRLYWFTVEFGLMRTPAGIRAYGAGILSSRGETPWAVESPEPRRVPFDTLEALRTPYRIDIMQPLYFVIDGLDTLYELARTDLRPLIDRARELGDHPPAFPTGDHAPLAAYG